MKEKGFAHILILITIIVAGTIGVLYFNSSLEKPLDTNQLQQNSFELTENINNWKLYEDPNKQFSFNFPNTMSDIVQKEPSRGHYEETLTAVSETTKSINGHPNALARIEVKGPFPSSGNEQIENYLQKEGIILPTKGISHGETSEIKRQQVTIDSEPSILIIEKMVDSGYPLNYTLYFQTDLGIYSLNLFSNDESTLTDSDFNNIIASINFTYKGTETPPTGWYSIPSKKCNMSFLAPDDRVEVKGLTENEILRIFDWNATFSLVKDNYPVSVEVLCSPNDKSFTTDSLVARIEQIVTGNTQSQNRRIPSKILSKVKSNRWGREVYVLTYDAGDFPEFYEGNNYVFATESNTYSVRIVDKLSDPQTSAVIQQIFEKLEFN